MPTSDLITRLEREFMPNQTQALAAELEAAHEAWMKARDLTELKDLVRDLGLSQQRTDARFQGVAEQQKRTDAVFQEMMEAQRQMQQAIEKLTLAQLRTEGVIQSMRQEIGGVANSLGYQLEEVEKHYPAAQGREIAPIMVVHFAREKELQRAEREGVIVVQSFEWQP